MTRYRRELRDIRRHSRPQNPCATAAPGGRPRGQSVIVRGPKDIGRDRTNARRAGRRVRCATSEQAPTRRGRECSEPPSRQRRYRALLRTGRWHSQAPLDQQNRRSSRAPRSEHTRTCRPRHDRGIQRRVVDRGLRVRSSRGAVGAVRDERAAVRAAGPKEHRPGVHRTTQPINTMATKLAQPGPATSHRALPDRRRRRESANPPDARKRVADGCRNSILEGD